MPLDLSTLPLEAIADLCRQRGIARLAVFGSALRDDFRPESDLDLLVEFVKGRKIGLEYFTIQADLSKLIGRPVDLNTRGWISNDFVADVLKEAKNLYVAA